MTRKPTYEELEQQVKELENAKSGRKQTEESLRESEVKHRTLLENIPQKIFFKDTDSIYVSCNQHYAKDLKINSEEITGKTDYEFYPKELAEKYREDDKKVIQIGETVEIEEKYIINGQNIFVQTVKTPVRDEIGNVTGILGIFWDITERKQAEEALRKAHDELENRVEKRTAELSNLNEQLKQNLKERKQAEEILRESEERFRMIFKSSSDGIIVADPETKKFQHVNPAMCKMLGYTEGELTQMGVADIHPKNQLEHVAAEFEALARGEKLLAMNIPFLKKNGKIIYMDTNASIVRIDKKFRLMGVFRDITDRKLAEEALKKAYDELEQRVEERTRELEIKTRGLEEINTAMTILLKKREEDKIELEDNVLTNVKELVEPYFEKIKKTKLDDQQEAFFSIIESNLKEIISPFTRKMSLKYLNLTPTEIQVANMTKHGNSSKKIAKVMNISPRTVDTHKKNIRRKIGLQGTRGNLRSYLLALH